MLDCFQIGIIWWIFVLGTERYIISFDPYHTLMSSVLLISTLDSWEIRGQGHTAGKAEAQLWVWRARTRYSHLSLYNVSKIISNVSNSKYQLYYIINSSLYKWVTGLYFVPCTNLSIPVLTIYITVPLQYVLISGIANPSSVFSTWKISWPLKPRHLVLWTNFRSNLSSVQK